MEENPNNKITKNEYFKATDVAKKLQIGDSTVRKYALILEELGVSFRVGSRNARFFTKEQIIIIGKMSQLLKETGMSPEKAAEAILNQYENETAATTELSPNVAGEKQEMALTAEQIQQVLSELFYLRENAITPKDLDKFKEDMVKTITEEVRKELKPLVEEKAYQAEQLYKKNIIEQKPEKSISLFQKVKGLFGSN